MCCLVLACSAEPSETDAHLAAYTLLEMASSCATTAFHKSPSPQPTPSMPGPASHSINPKPMPNSKSGPQQALHQQRQVLPQQLGFSGVPFQDIAAAVHRRVMYAAAKAQQQPAAHTLPSASDAAAASNCQHSSSSFGPQLRSAAEVAAVAGVFADQLTNQMAMSYGGTFGAEDGALAAISQHAHEQLQQQQKQPAPEGPTAGNTGQTYSSYGSGSNWSNDNTCGGSAQRSFTMGAVPHTPPVEHTAQSVSSSGSGGRSSGGSSKHKLSRFGTEHWIKLERQRQQRTRQHAVTYLTAAAAAAVPAA